MGFRKQIVSQPLARQQVNFSVVVYRHIGLGAFDTARRYARKWIGRRVTAL